MIGIIMMEINVIPTKILAIVAAMTLLEELAILTNFDEKMIIFQLELMKIANYYIINLYISCLS